jgi:hypothetical protein
VNSDIEELSKIPFSDSNKSTDSINILLINNQNERPNAIRGAWENKPSFDSSPTASELPRTKINRFAADHQGPSKVREYLL